MHPFEQEYINQETSMKPQHYDSKPITTSLSPELCPERRCGEGSIVTSITPERCSERLCEEESSALHDYENQHTENNFPFWVEEAEDDDSQSCDWSIESSNTFRDDDCWNNEDIDENSSAELDQYLTISFERQTIENEKSIKFNENPVSAVFNFEKPSREYYKNMYYTVHELQMMIDEFAQKERSHNGVSSSSE
mmetsp:Transcript_14207/g.21671  ORF Transcript_14207/g.21671 Transcript_14207/m.21671 type:complete len:194 (+) Transcript_14207:98-679(+)